MILLTPTCKEEDKQKLTETPLAKAKKAAEEEASASEESGEKSASVSVAVSSESGGSKPRGPSLIKEEHLQATEEEL